MHTPHEIFSPILFVSLPSRQSHFLLEDNQELGVICTTKSNVNPIMIMGMVPFSFGSASHQISVLSIAYFFACEMLLQFIQQNHHVIWKVEGGTPTKTFQSSHLWISLVLAMSMYASLTLYTNDDSNRNKQKRSGSFCGLVWKQTMVIYNIPLTQTSIHPLGTWIWPCSWMFWTFVKKHYHVCGTWTHVERVHSVLACSRTQSVKKSKKSKCRKPYSSYNIHMQSRNCIQWLINVFCSYKTFRDMVKHVGWRKEMIIDRWLFSGRTCWMSYYEIDDGCDVGVCAQLMANVSVACKMFWVKWAEKRYMGCWMSIDSWYNSYYLRNGHTPRWWPYLPHQVL